MKRLSKSIIFVITMTLIVSCGRNIEVDVERIKEIDNREQAFNKHMVYLASDGTELENEKFLTSGNLEELTELLLEAEEIFSYYVNDAKRYEALSFIRLLNDVEEFDVRDKEELKEGLDDIRFTIEWIKEIKYDMSTAFLTKYDNIGFYNYERDYFVFFHNSDKYMTKIDAYNNDYYCIGSEVDKTNKEISCSDELIEYIEQYSCKIIKNTSSLFIDECQLCNRDGRFIVTYWYNFDGDTLILKKSTDYLDGSEIKKETFFFRKTTRTFESFECN